MFQYTCLSHNRTAEYRCVTLIISGGGVAVSLAPVSLRFSGWSLNNILLAWNVCHSYGPSGCVTLVCSNPYVHIIWDFR